MSESLFNIFSDHYTRQAVQNVSRQPLSNIENMGKKVMGGPLKPNEPLKTNGDNKKSFLKNSGKALQNTPIRSVFTPRPVNVGSLIYNDQKTHAEKDQYLDELEFTKPSFKYDNYHTDLLDYLPQQHKPVVDLDLSPPRTPRPVLSHRYSMEFDNSYQDEFFSDDFYENIPEENDLNLPKLY